MTKGAESVDQWKNLNAHNLVDCRWGCRITQRACRSYQTRTRRSIIHFNGSLDACSRVNAEYLRCLLPSPCPHAVSDREAAEAESHKKLHVDALSVRLRTALHQARELERLASPDGMLQESRWHRSLVKS